MSELAQPVNENAASWWVDVRGQAYGPYTQAQMIMFVGEGRVRANTRVSQDPQGDWVEARGIEALMAPFRSSSFISTAKQGEDAANIFVHAELVSGAYNNFIAALEGLGALVELTPTLWLVRSVFSAGVIRNTLSQTLERGDRFVVIDATRDRFAWFNLGPELDVRIKDVWNTPIRSSGGGANVAAG